MPLLPTNGVSTPAARVMMIAAAGLLVAGAFAAFVKGGDDDEVATLDRQTSVDDTMPTTTTRTTDDEGAASDDVDDAATTTVADAAPEDAVAAPDDDDPAPGTARPDSTDGSAPTTSEPAPATTAASGQATQRQLNPVPPGTYEYDTDGTSSINGDSKPMPETTSLTAGEVGADNRQTNVRDMRDDGGDGSVTKTTFLFTAEGVYLEKLESTFFLNKGTFSQTSTLTPTSPYLLIPADATVGTKTSGQMSGDGLTADITFEVLEIGEDTNKSRLIADISGEAEGRQTSEYTTRNSDLLTVHEKAESDIRSGPARLQSSYTATLR